MIFQLLVEIIDLEKDCMTVGFKRAKVVFLMRVVSMAKVVKDFDCPDNAGYGLCTEGGDACGHHGMTVAATDMFSQVVVECADAVCLAGFTCLLTLWAPMTGAQTNRVAAADAATADWQKCCEVGLVGGVRVTAAWRHTGTTGRRQFFTWRLQKGSVARPRRC